MTTLLRADLIAIAKEKGQVLKKHPSAHLGNNYFSVFTDGTISDMFFQRTCYGSCAEARSIEPARRLPVFFVTWNPGANKKPTLWELRYFKWLLNYSPYAKAFVTKDPYEIFKGPVIMDANYDPRFVIGAAQLVRLQAEYPWIIRDWNRFRRYTGAELAFCLAIHFKKIENVKGFATTGLYSHTNMDKNTLTGDRIQGFVTRNTLLRDNKMSDNNYAYPGTPHVWGTGTQKVKWPKKAGKEDKQTNSWGDATYTYTYQYVDMPKFLAELVEINSFKFTKDQLAK